MECLAYYFMVVFGMEKTLTAWAILWRTGRIDGWRGTFQWHFSFYLERRLIPYSWETSYISRGVNYIGE